MRIFHIQPEGFEELQALPEQLPAQGFVWIGSGRREFEVLQPELQAAFPRWGLRPLVDLHTLDLLNAQLPSHFDSTSWYDLLIFRRLAVPSGSEALLADDAPLWTTAARDALLRIDTSPVGFAVYDKLLLTVHPADCAVRDFFAQRLATAGDGRASAARLPNSPADLMLRMTNHMVDGYLALRRLLTRYQSDLQAQLLDPKSRFHDWQQVLESRNLLQMLEDTSEDQRAAIQEWIDALDEWPRPADDDERQERELLRVRSRDVLEHIERVLSHARRMEQSAETAVQMHFSAQGQRTNDIMRTLTVLTALFLPLNLITGFFGMNFDGLPLIHSETGVWIAGGMMAVIALALGSYFWRRRFLVASDIPGGRPER